MYEGILPLVVGVIALAMSVVLLDKYRSTKHMYHVLWSFGMFLWAVSDFTQFYAIILKWTAAVYLAYFFSSIMLAGFLGAGTVYLAASKSKAAVHFNMIA